MDSFQLVLTVVLAISVFLGQFALKHPRAYLDAEWSLALFFAVSATVSAAHELGRITGIKEAGLPEPDVLGVAMTFAGGFLALEIVSVALMVTARAIERRSKRDAKKNAAEKGDPAKVDGCA